ncbi:MAG: FecCD family ABC transporter permease [Pseudomonadales bacterium]
MKLSKSLSIAAALLAAIAALAVLGVITGVSQISAAQAINILLQGAGVEPLFDTAPWRKSQAVIITELRAPRVVLALLAGAGLAVCGAALQAATRNPLTDPFLLGVSSGASLGAVLVITQLGAFLGTYTLPLFSFGGGLLSFALLLTLLRRPANQRPDRLILAGVAISFLLMAATNGLIFFGDQRAAQSIVFWMLGGFGLARWDLLALPAGLIVAGIVVLLWQARNLNALMMGQESAAALGLEVNRVRGMILLVATLVTSLIVSLSGTIGFVGLVVPHIVRTFVGGDNRILLPLCVLAGAAFMLAADIVSRQLIAPQELPIGIITGAIGGAYFCYLLLRR